jgi:peptide chain release factor subunit 1
VLDHPVLDGKTLKRLLRFRSLDAPVVSLYVAVPVDPGEVRGAPAALHTLVKPLRELAESDELSHAARESLRADAAKILELVPRALQQQGKAMGVFACSRENFYEEVALPRQVRDRVVVDATPYVRPLLAVLDESHRYCVVVVDRERAWVHAFDGGQLEDVTKEAGRVLRKPDYGGWHGLDEYRVRNKAEEWARRHFRETAEAVERQVQRTGAEFLIVGGHEETIPNFLPFLPHDLQGRVAGTFVIDPHTLTPARVGEQAQRVVDEYERREEQELVARALERVAMGGLGAAGLEWCLAAADAKAIQLLLIHDEQEVPGRVCDNCGWLGLEGEDCPVCGAPTRKTPDVIDEMAAAVVDASGSVEHVYADTPLAQHVVAALLRFPVPPP